MAMSVGAFLIGLCTSGIVFCTNIVVNTRTAPLPYEAGEQIVHVIQSSGPIESLDRANLLNQTTERADAEHLIAMVRTLAPVGIISMPQEALLANDGVSKRATIRRVSGGYFETFGIKPILGRLFTDRDTLEGHPRAAIITRSAWVTEYNADATVLGRTIMLDGAPAEIVGVMPSSFVGDRGLFGWTPFVASVTVPSTRGRRGNVSDPVWIVGRLRAGATLSAAQSEITLHTRALTRLGGERLFSIVDARVFALPGTTEFTERVGGLLIAFLSIITAVSLTLLALARIRAQRRDIAIKRALGGNRWQLTKPYVCEAAIMSAAGALGGTWLAVQLGQVVVGAIGGERPWWLERLVGPGAIIAGIAMGMVLSAIAYVAPALTILGDDQRPEMQSSYYARTSVRTTGNLVLAQVAVGIITLSLVGTAFLSVMKVGTIAFGFDADPIVQVLPKLDMSADRLLDLSARAQALRGRIAAYPQVTQVGTIQTGRRASVQLSALGSRIAKRKNVRFTFADEHLFATLHQVPAFGRLMTGQEVAELANVAVLMKSTASHWDARFESLVGSTIGVELPGESSIRTLLVIGIVDDFNFDGRQADSTDEMLFSPMALRAGSPIRYLASGDGSTDSVASSMSRAFGQDAQMRGTTAVPFLATFRARQGAIRLPLYLLAPIAAMGCIAALMGVFGLVSFVVDGRAYELGVRAALGATPRQNVILVTRQTGTFVVQGSVIGAIVTIALAPPIASALQLGAPLAWMPAAIAVAFTLFAGLSVVSPLRRAARFDLTTQMRRA
ncbi:MAG: ABC transporter permease [bacterium]